MTASHNQHTKGLLLTAIGGMALTFDIPLVKLAQGEAWSILMLRSATTFAVVLVLWAVWRFFTPNTPALVPGRAGAAVAALYGLGSTAFIVGVYHTSTANLVFLLAFNTMFAALLSWIFLKERPGTATLATMAVMIVGVLVIVGDSLGSGHLLGDIMGVLSALFIASAITITRSTGKDMGFASLVGVILPFIIAWVMIGTGDGYRIDAPWWIVLNGAFVIPVAFFCLANGPKYISGPEVAMFYLLETVLAPVWVWMIFAEKPSRNSLIGGAILIAALVAHSLWQLRQGRMRRAAPMLRHPA